MAFSLDRTLVVLFIIGLLHVASTVHGHGGGGDGDGRDDRRGWREDHDDWDDYDDDDDEGSAISTSTLVAVGVGGVVMLLFGVVGVVICCMKNCKRAEKSGKTTPIQSIQVDASAPPPYDSIMFMIPSDKKPPPYEAGPMNSHFNYSKHGKVPPPEEMKPAPSPTPSAASLPNAVDDVLPTFPQKY